LILYTAAEQRRLAAEDAKTGALRMARLVASDHERVADEIRQLLVTLGHLSETRGSRPETCSQLFAGLLNQYPQYTNLGVISLQGEVVCSAVPLQAPLNLAGSDYFQQAVREHEFASGGIQLDSLLGSPSLSFALPVIDDSGEMVSVVFATLSLDWLNQLVTESQLPESAVLIIFDENGTILVHLPDYQPWLGKNLAGDPLYHTIIAEEEGTAELAGNDGIPRLYGFTRLNLPSTGHYFVGVGVSRDLAFQNANRILTRHLWGLSAAFVLALSAAWFGGELFVIRRVKAILSATQRFAAGDFSARTGLSYGSGELSQLALVFDQMGQVLERRENERVRAENEIKLHVRDLTAINTLMATVSSSLELTEVLESLKRVLEEQLNVPGGVIFLYDKAGDILCLEAAWGIPSAVLAQFKSFPARSYHYEQVLRNREILLQPDCCHVEPYALTDLRLIRPNLQSYLCIPLLAKGEVQGVIDLFSQAPKEFSHDQVRLFTTLGQELGVVIHNAQLFEQVVLARQRLQLLSSQLIDVQEKERRRLSRELHDEIGQALTAVKVNLQAMGRLADLSVLAPHMEESISIIDRTIQQVRNLSLDLRPSLLDDLGVVSALRWYVDRQARRAGFEAHFMATPPEMRLPDEIETTCFRIVQEALTNVVRHAHARRVSIDLQQIDAELDLSIRDDGVGFDVDAVGERPPSDMSLGLLGMRERAQLVGGQIEIRSDSERGTSIHVRLPLNPDLDPGRVPGAMQEETARNIE
ncbi:MAG: GAF domain-containing protein, partial [Chloroflexota bacterium]